MRITFLPYINQSNHSYFTSFIEAIKMEDNSTYIIPMHLFLDILIKVKTI